MEIRDVIFAVVMLFSTFVLVYRLLARYGEMDPVTVLAAVILIGMIALLFLSTNARLRRVEKDIGEKERSIRVSLQSVEEEVREKVDTAVRSFSEAAKEKERQRKGYR
jgi:Sec-independent protein translocase protein TatA